MTTKPIRLPRTREREVQQYESELDLQPKTRHGLRTLLADGMQRPLYLCAAILLLFLITVAVVAPLLPLTDPDHQSLLDRMSGPLAADNSGYYHLAGTDQLGRDIFSRVIYGARISLFVALAVVAISSVAGITLGLIAGYKGGIVDNVVMRVVDFQQAFPPILWAIFILYLIGSSLTNLIILLALLNWVGYARIVRAHALAAQPALRRGGDLDRRLRQTHPAATHPAPALRRPQHLRCARLRVRNPCGGRIELPRPGRAAANLVPGAHGRGRPGVPLHRRVVALCHPRHRDLPHRHLGEPDVEVDAGARRSRTVP
jgi:hypothetical protein